MLASPDAMPPAEPNSATPPEQALADALAVQTGLIEEIRDQFAEHLELQRQILRLLMAEHR